MIAVINFLIYSNIWIALAAVSLNLYFYKILQIKPDLIVCAFVFAATLFIYNFQRIVKLKTTTAFSGNRLTWMSANLNLSKGLTLIGFLTSSVLFFLLEIRTVFFLIPIGIIALFYVGKFFLKGVVGFRDIPFMKVYFVSFSWVGVTAVLPALNAHAQFNSRIFLLSISIFLLVFALAIIFDLRDINLDEKSKRTIPQLLGKRRTILLSILCLFLAMIIPLLIDSSIWVVALLVILVGTVLILNVSEEKPDLYFSFFLDGILILPGLISFF